MNKSTRFGVFIIMVAVISMLCYNSAFAESKGIARLDHYKGNVVIKSLGSWGAPVENGMPLYRGDKILTMDGSASISFHDKTTLEVLPNSVIRIVEAVEKKGGVFKNEKKRREIRMFIGKVKYKSGKIKNTSTLLISPTAVAALRGTDVGFGSDGNRGFIQLNEGKSDNAGDMIEGFVPDSTGKAVEKNEVYQSSMKAIQAFGKYSAVKISFERIRFKVEKGPYSEASRTDRVVAIKRKSRKYKSVRYAEGEYIQLLGSLLQYAKAGTEELIAENNAFQNTPEQLVAESSKEALNIAKKSIKVINSLITQSNELKKSFLSMKDEKGWNDKDRLANYKLMEAILEYSSTAEKMGLSQMLLVEHYTIAIFEAIEAASDLAAISIESAPLANDFKNKTQTYLDAMLSADDSKLGSNYYRLAEMTVAMVVGNAGVSTLAANALETLFIGDKVRMEIIFKELWPALEARDGFIPSLGKIEASESISKADEKQVAKMLQLVESSTHIFNAFAMDFRRLSIVLSPPEFEWIGILPHPYALETYPIIKEPVRHIPETERDDLDDRDGDGWTVARGDCNDSDASIYPNPPEVKCADEIDNDCDEFIDCKDSDCFDVAICQAKKCDDKDNDKYFAQAGCGTAIDCNDNDPDVHPGSPEVDCTDLKDNDCDGLIDCRDPSNCSDDSACVTVCTDNDGDGYFTQAGCGDHPGQIDCDDGDSQVYPRSIEDNCSDNKDNDCDGFIDCADSDCVGNSVCKECTDKDGDNYFAEAGCGTEVDCKDSDPAIHPGDPETSCKDGIDNDCDGFIDCADSDCVGTSDCKSCTDKDEDGYFAEAECSTEVDCNDNDPAIHPGNPETNCNDNIDNDCDKLVDCKDSDCTGSVDCKNDQCIDADSDGSFVGHGCFPVDCDDSDPARSPDNPEICDDKIDNDCDGHIDCDDTDDCASEQACNCTDQDKDGYFLEDGCGTEIDCDDTNQAIYPGATEICGDSIDQDCDGLDYPCTYTGTPESGNPGFRWPGPGTP
ncbi:MopE-related protein [Desulfobacterales bacterium HSG16]|nr:MopE-related protein [Desulfobacterales bacterium HSG16]